jgi:hypothetical protein
MRKLLQPIGPIKQASNGKIPGGVEPLKKIERPVNKIETPRVKIPSVKIQNIRIRIKRPHA